MNVKLLEINLSRYISASIRLEESTAAHVDHYAAFVHAPADDVVDKALNFVFSKDREFPEFLRRHRQVASTLRIRRVPKGVWSRGTVHTSCAGGKGVILPLISCRSKNAVLRTGRRVDTSPPNGNCRAPWTVLDVYAG
jgi:hypothetical protein